MVKNIIGLSKMKESLLINETFNLAYKNHEKNFFKKAEDLYKKILNIDSNHFESIFLLGTLYAQTKKFNEALQFLSKAKDIQPNNPDVYNNLGGVLKELEIDHQTNLEVDKVSAIQNFSETSYWWNAYYTRGFFIGSI